MVDTVNFFLPFSLNKMFVRKSNNKVHVIFKYTIENIKVSTFAANGKRQFVPRDCSLLLPKKIRSFTTVLLIKNVLDCFFSIRLSQISLKLDEHQSLLEEKAVVNDFGRTGPSAEIFCCK